MKMSSLDKLQAVWSTWCDRFKVKVFLFMLQDFDSDEKKVIRKTLRFLAHYYAASLIVSEPQQAICPYAV